MALTSIEEYKKALRTYIRDFEFLNRLLDFKEENSDDGLELYLNMAIGYLNIVPPSVGSFGFANFPLPSLLIHQSAIEALVSNGILQSRNDVEYNNAGISLKVDDRQRYLTSLNALNLLISNELDMFAKYKININFFRGFGGSHSPYVNLPRQRGWSGRIV
jgi:hypothetical protein